MNKEKQKKKGKKRNGIHSFAFGACVPLCRKISVRNRRRRSRNLNGSKRVCERALSCKLNYISNDMTAKTKIKYDGMTESNPSVCVRIKVLVAELTGTKSAHIHSNAQTNKCQSLRRGISEFLIGDFRGSKNQLAEWEELLLRSIVEFVNWLRC